MSGFARTDTKILMHTQIGSTMTASPASASFPGVAPLGLLVLDLRVVADALLLVTRGAWSIPAELGSKHGAGGAQ